MANGGMDTRRPFMVTTPPDVAPVREVEQRQRASRATDIQRSYRGVLGRRKACKRRIEVAQTRKQQAAASLMIQKRFRMHRWRCFLNREK